MRIAAVVTAAGAVVALGAACLAARLGTVEVAHAQDRASAVEAAIKSSWTRTTPEWRERLVQDETQKLCTQHRNAPPGDVANAILVREKATIQYPPDGKLMGDWKNGEKLAQSGYVWRFTDYPPRQENGGNCYACHQLDKKELSFGTLGPSLLGYGKARKHAEADVKAVYERIYNPHAAVACANMPRFGASSFLSLDQIKDLVAYVMSPDSPVNK
jgi:sulfur-oxidizing protein SoxX